MARKVVLYIAMSLDGYIAKPNDNLDFLSLVQSEGEDYGYVDFIESIDTVIMGRKTYDWVMKQVDIFPHADKNTFIITRTSRPNTGMTQYYTGGIKELILNLKSGSGKTIYCDGGAEIVNELLKDNLIDELIISIIPVLLGEGIKLFRDGRPELLIKLKAVKSYTSGLVQLHYTRG
jgi:dihydrofolate reductase